MYSMRFSLVLSNIIKAGIEKIAIKNTSGMKIREFTTDIIIVNELWEIESNPVKKVETNW